MACPRLVAPDMPPVRDVAIVGAGLLGLAAGQALAARGRDVVVLEQAEVGHPGSGSKGSARIFRLGYPDPYYVAAARQARDRWHELETRSERRILRPVPHLTFGTGLRAVQDAMTAAGAASQLLQAADVAEKFPALRVDGPALLEPDSAVIAADEALTVLAAGVPEIRPGVRVIRLADDGRQVTLRTTAGAITARTAIITAGPWSGGLLASVSVAVPGRPTLEQVAYLRPSGQDDAPIFIRHGEQAPYGVPVPGSRLYKIGIHPSGPATDPDAQNQGADQRLMRRLAEVARRYLPGYHPDPVTTERCVYDNSPDEDFVIDRIGNVVIGCGTSGHGFKFGPLLGEWLADLATGPDSVLAEDGLRQRFSIRRFARLD
jgi:sarcosine oxidase